MCVLQTKESWDAAHIISGVACMVVIKLEAALIQAFFLSFLCSDKIKMFSIAVFYFVLSYLIYAFKTQT